MAISKKAARKMLVKLTASPEIEIVSESDVGGDLGSFTHFVGNLDNLVYFNEDELCGEVLESFHIQVCKLDR